PIDGADKSPLLKSADTQGAELLAALKEVAAKGAELKGLLGPWAPDASIAGVLHDQIDALWKSKLRATTLAQFLEDKHDVAINDGMVYYGQVKKELLHAMEHNPDLTREFPNMLALINQISAAVADGKARKKAEVEKAKAEKKDGNGEKKDVGDK